MPTEIEFPRKRVMLVPKNRYSDHQDDYVDAARPLTELGFTIHSLTDDGKKYLISTPPGWQVVEIDWGDLIEYRDQRGVVRVKQQKNGRDGLFWMDGEHLLIAGYS